jgi:alpha/beta superfamily hydrolase
MSHHAGALERLTVAGPAGPLETIAEVPQNPSAYYALVCHPHPVFGGTMDNKVVTTLARTFATAGMPALRFNFRGVGASAGAFDQGRGETADAFAVADYGAARWPGRSLVLAGFSFGAYVAWRFAHERAVARLILVAPPVDRFDFTDAAAPSAPCLVIQGDSDEVVDAGRVTAWVHGLTPTPSLAVMPQTGHFFHGQLTRLRDAVQDAIQGG